MSSRREDDGVSLDTSRTSNAEIAANGALPKGRGLLAKCLCYYFAEPYCFAAAGFGNLIGVAAGPEPAGGISGSSTTLTSLGSSKSASVTLGSN